MEMEMEMKTEMEMECSTSQVHPSLHRFFVCFSFSFISENNKRFLHGLDTEIFRRFLRFPHLHPPKLPISNSSSNSNSRPNSTLDPSQKSRQCIHKILKIYHPVERHFDPCLNHPTACHLSVATSMHLFRICDHLQKKHKGVKCIPEQSIQIDRLTSMCVWCSGSECCWFQDEGVRA